MSASFTPRPAGSTPGPLPWPHPGAPSPPLVRGGVPRLLLAHGLISPRFRYGRRKCQLEHHSVTCSLRAWSYAPICPVVSVEVVYKQQNERTVTVLVGKAFPGLSFLGSVGLAFAFSLQLSVAKVSGRCHQPTFQVGKGVADYRWGLWHGCPGVPLCRVACSRSRMNAVVWSDVHVWGPHALSLVNCVISEPRQMWFSCTMCQRPPVSTHSGTHASSWWGEGSPRWAVRPGPPQTSSDSVGGSLVTWWEVKRVR